MPAKAMTSPVRPRLAYTPPDDVGDLISDLTSFIARHDWRVRHWLKRSKGSQEGVQELIETLHTVSNDLVLLAQEIGRARDE